MKLKILILFANNRVSYEEYSSASLVFMFAKEFKFQLKTRFVSAERRVGSLSA
jgi:hypothetical protein